MNADIAEVQRRIESMIGLRPILWGGGMGGMEKSRQERFEAKKKRMANGRK